MRRFMVFVMMLFFLLGATQGYGAEKGEKKPAQKSSTPQEVKSSDTTYHALIIGNNQYKYLPKLNTAQNDAIEVEKLLKEKFKFQTVLLLDATRANILGKINEMRKRLGEKDSLLIYYAGHGEYDKTVDKAYWLPVDAQRDDPTNWIMADDITSNIKRIAARHVLIVSDSCFSGTLTRQAVTELISTGGRDEYLKKMQERQSRTLMASGGNEPVSDSGGGNNSVFAAAFIKAMKESDIAQFTAEEIFHTRIKEIVAGKSDQVPEYSNIKNSGHEGGDFVFRLASIGIEATKPEATKKDQRKEEADRIQKERKKLDEERARVEAERKRLEEKIKLDEERAKVNEEKQKLEEARRQKEEEERRLALAKRPPEKPKEIQDTVTGMEFVLVPAGSFMMGSPANEEDRYNKDDREGPLHQVEITRSFYLGKKEVTVGQFRKFVKETGYKTEAETDGGAFFYSKINSKWEKKKGIYWDNLDYVQNDRHPVACVSWNDVQKFIEWLNQKMGVVYRLPTEAEWEYAARAGTTTSRFWGDDPDKACKYGNVSDQTIDHANNLKWLPPRHECDDFYFYTAPVGKFRPNAFGLYDMLGNVSEWCADWFDKDYYKNSPSQNPTGPSSGSHRVCRGGGYNTLPNFTRTATRDGGTPNFRRQEIGFRLARDN